MITIKKLEEALREMHDIEVMKNSSNKKIKSILFSKKDDRFTLTLLEPDAISTTKIKLTKVVLHPNHKRVKRKDAELVEASVNLTLENPCKVVYVYQDNNQDSGFFVIDNIFTDKLDYFTTKESEEKITEDLKILILGMIIEIFRCMQAIKKEADDIDEKELNKDKEGNM